MKYALIGCGRISVNHIAAAQANKLDIVAISDILPEKMDEKRAKFDLDGNTKGYADYKEMLAKEKPELVAICTESGEHARIALDCIDAGCHVIIEKPIACRCGRNHRAGKKARRQSLHQPSEPLQQIHTENPGSNGSGTLR